MHRRVSRSLLKHFSALFVVFFAQSFEKSASSASFFAGVGSWLPTWVVGGFSVVVVVRCGAVCLVVVFAGYMFLVMATGTGAFVMVAWFWCYRSRGRGARGVIVLLERVEVRVSVLLEWEVSGGAVFFGRSW